MIGGADPSDVPSLNGRRVRLEPLRVEHASEMAPLLDDSRLHVYIGGQPAGLAELQERYRRQVVGQSPDGSERWLNWVVRRLSDGQAVGIVQATVVDQVAELAWVIGVAHQKQGYAREAATVMVAELRDHGVRSLVAHVHPEHEASAAIARALGLAPTRIVDHGEVRWEGTARAAAKAA